MVHRRVAADLSHPPSRYQPEIISLTAGRLLAGLTGWKASSSSAASQNQAWQILDGERWGCLVRLPDSTGNRQPVWRADRNTDGGLRVCDHLPADRRTHWPRVSLLSPGLLQWNLFDCAGRRHAGSLDFGPSG